MKIQSVNVITKKDYQKKPSFNGIIVDTRGIETLEKGVLSNDVIKTLETIKRFISIKLKNIDLSTHDFLVYPFKAEGHVDGIAIQNPHEDGFGTSWFYSNDFEGITPKRILHFIKTFWAGSTTFEKAVKGNLEHKYIWDTSMPLPDKVIKDRFNDKNLVIKI